MSTYAAHKRKKRLARRLMTQEEWQKKKIVIAGGKFADNNGNIITKQPKIIKKGTARTPIFQSKAWEERKYARTN